MARHTLIATMVALAFAAAAPAAMAAPAKAAIVKVAAKPDAAFDKWADAYTADWVRLSPEFATNIQFFSGEEQAALDRLLTPQTREQRARQVALAKAGLAKVEQFLKSPKLDRTQRTSAETMRWSLENAIENAKYDDYSFVFSQFSGAHIRYVSFMTETHPMRRAADLDSYLARLALIGQRIDEAVLRSRAATDKGLLPPKFILERAQGQVDAFLKHDPARNPLAATLESRLANLKDVTPEQRAAAIAKAAAIVGESVIPAYKRVAAYLAELHPRTTDAAGITRLPGGAEAYAQALRNFTGTKLKAEEIHQIGLREVARIEAEMDKHLRSLGLSEGSIEQRMRQLDERFQLPAEPDPRAEIINRYTAMVRDAEQRSRKLFNIMPKAPVEVRREPPLTEGSAAAHYSVPAPDGSRPGIFWVPLRGPKFDMVRMRSLAYHEAVPGHHFQLAIMQELTNLPKFRTYRIFSGGSSHSEGWALYTERLAVEQGWYEGDVPGLLGALGSELFRARRLVVDTGIHTKGWTRQQAIDYGIGAQEVERYTVWPGQANAYMLGMLRILELREHAKKQLGDKFSLPAFHDVILTTASVPLDVLAKVIDDWIAEERRKN
jgi:uncharacterized protein (DUF885 family)